MLQLAPKPPQVAPKPLAMKFWCN